MITKCNESLIERELLAGKSASFILGELEADDGDNTLDQKYWAILVKKVDLEPSAFRAGYEKRKTILSEVKELMEGAKNENQP